MMGIKGKPISPDYKKAIVSVKKYFDLIGAEKADAELKPVEKTAKALGVGSATVKRVMAEYNRDPDLIERESSKRGCPRRIISESCETLARDYIRNANNEGTHITLEMLSEHLLDNSEIDNFSIRTLGRALDRWGYTFGKGTRSQHLKEKDYVIAARRRYLREKRANRRDESTIRPEVYLDETYVNKNHSNDFIWYSDVDGPWVKKPTGKGERLIILNAITKDGWVPNASLVFKSTKRTGDYHGQMNHELFTKWFKEKLLPNIPANALIVMDNASYHNVLSSHSSPTSNSKKEVIVDWLQKNGVPISADSLKAELVEVLENRAPVPTYAIDEIAAENGHKVIRTPPYHPELQPIETCWGVVKNQVARNCEFTMANLQKQLTLAFDAVTSKTCLGLIKKVRDVEDSYWKYDGD
jgi:transposase